MSLTRIDYDLLNELSDILEDEFPIIIDTFIESASKLLSELLVLLKEGNNDLYILKIHSLKGSCRNIGATYLAELCMKEEMLAQKGLINLTDTSLELIAHELEKTKKVLTSYPPYPSS